MKISKFVLTTIISIVVLTLLSLTVTSQTREASLTVGSGMNAMDLFMAYQGHANGGDGTPEYTQITKAMAKKSIKDAGQHNIKFLRVAVCGYGPYDLDPWRTAPASHWALMDEMIEDLTINHVKLVPTFIWWERQFPMITGETVENMIKNPESMAFQLAKKYIYEFITRYKENSTVLFYELMNEINLLADFPMVEGQGEFTTDQMIDYMNRLASYIRSIDNVRSISSGYGCPKKEAYNLWKYGKWSPDTIDQCKEYIKISHGTLDIISVHIYNTYKDNERFGYTGHYNTEHINVFKATADECGKTLFIGEYGDAYPFSMEDPSCRFSQNVLSKVMSLNIPFSAGWDWEFYQLQTTEPNPFNIEPGYHNALIDKIKETNIALGNQVISVQDTDTTPPNVVLTWPLSDRAMSVPTQKVYALASDNSGVITKVEFILDGAIVNTSITQPYTFDLVTESLSSGTHSLIAKAYDGAGNTSECVSSVITGPRIPGSKKPNKRR